METFISRVLQQYSNLLMEEARRPWCKILGKQIDVTPWANLFGVDNAEKHHRSWKSFMDYVSFHLLTVSGVTQQRPRKYQQQVEESQRGADQAVCAEDPEA